MPVTTQPPGANGLSVLLHIHDRFALSLRLVEGLVKPSDRRGEVVGPRTCVGSVAFSAKSASRTFFWLTGSKLGASKRLGLC
jgi:hypothetical protein